MSNLVVLQEHIAALRAIVNTPDVPIKSFDALIKQLRWIHSTQADNPQALKKSLDALQITPETFKRLVAEDISFQSSPLVMLHRNNIFSAQAFLAKELAKIADSSGLNSFVSQVNTTADEYQKNHTWCRSGRQRDKKETLTALSQHGSCLLTGIRTNQSVDHLLLTMGLMHQLIEQPSLMRRGTLVSFVFGCFIDSTSGTYRTLQQKLPNVETNASFLKQLETDLHGAEQALRNAAAGQPATSRRLTM